jgi:hypothetical protein
MKIGIMQPYFFPYLAYWQLINAVDKYVVYDDVNFIKNGWINRNFILVNNQKHLITLPLEGSSSSKLINEVFITQDQKSKTKLLRTIQQAYARAPYLDKVFPIIERFIEENQVISLAVYNSILDIVKYLEIDTEILISSKIDKNKDLKAQEKVIHITKLLQGTEYCNSIGGKDLYDTQDFQKEGIKLAFLSSKPVPYKQFNSEFVSDLSIIDVLMFNPPHKIKEMLLSYDIF